MPGVGSRRLAAFIDSGELPRHVRKTSRIYATRHARIMAALHGELGTWLEPVPSAAGLHLCARLTEPVDLDAVLASAAESGIAVENLAAYCACGPAQPGLVLGYGAIPTERVEPGLHRLADCFRSAAAG